MGRLPAPWRTLTGVVKEQQRQLDDSRRRSPFFNQSAVLVQPYRPLLVSPGLYTQSGEGSVTTLGAASVANEAYFMPFTAVTGNPVASITVDVTTAGTSTSCWLAVYYIDPATGLPTTKATDFGTFANTVTGQQTVSFGGTWAPMQGAPYAVGLGLVDTTGRFRSNGAQASPRLPNSPLIVGQQSWMQVQATPPSTLGATFTTQGGRDFWFALQGA